MMTYEVLNAGDNLRVADAAWDAIPAVEVSYTWKDYHPSSFHTKARLVHGDHGLTVRLTTDERPLVAHHSVRNEMICEDSCMEFFFIPNMTDSRYINIEINPLGITHIGLGPDRYDRRFLDITDSDWRIETLITDTVWHSMLYIPYSFLLRYYDEVSMEMRGNFYKCGDLTGHKHFAVWSPILMDRPDYHQSAFFGTFRLQ